MPLPICTRACLFFVVSLIWKGLGVSNFPVDRISVSTNVLWNTLKRVAAAKGLSETEKAALFAGTARRVYKLE